MKATGVFGLVALIILSVLSLFVGIIETDIGTLLRDPDQIQLMLVSRFPRTIAVLITGSALAICGMIMQMMVRNRFVEPMTSGTGEGAALGILLVTIFMPAAAIWVKMVLASVTALLSSMLFLALIQRLPPTQPLLVALVGLIYGGIIGAGVVFFAYQADLLQYIDVWTQGEFSGVLRGRYELLWIAAAVAALSYLVADQFAILGMGRTVAINLGLNYQQVLFMGLLSVSIVSALTVVTVGMIPFVGLVVPNLISRLYGDNLRATLPMVAILGAGMVLISDILGRVLRYPFEIPVGTVFGVIGTAIFLWMLYARPKHA